MSILQFELVLALSLFSYCGDSGSKPEVEDLTSVQEPTPTQKLAAKCDFSQYAPTRILHFAPDAVRSRVQPKYPRDAVQQRIEGRVTVKVLINEKGLVEQSCVVDGPELLQSSAETAALAWKFKPRYGLAFLRPRTSKNPKNYAEAFIVFEFKIDKTPAS